MPGMIASPLVKGVDGEYAVPTYKLEPVYLGPTFEKDPETGKFVLPEHTLGYQAIKWAHDHLLNDKGEPWRYTPEQARLVLWWYAVDERGVFAYREGVMQRIKGHGKDPLVATLCLIELIGPCRFDGWAVESSEHFGITAGEPIARDNPVAWIQVAAVTKKQTEATMRCFGWMISEELKRKYRLTVNKESVFAYGGKRQLIAVTSNPPALEGGRPTFVVRNETHHWKDSNDGHAMNRVIKRNLAKIPGGAARALSITNAYAPSEHSVAQKQRETWEAERADERRVDTKVMYDSIEAPKKTPLSPPRPEEIKGREYDELYSRMTMAWIHAILVAVRGDSYWLNPERITLEILNGEDPISESKRFYLNVIESAEDAWVDADAVDAAIDEFARARRGDREADQLRIGWAEVLPDEEVVLFGDGSKSNDSTAIVGVRVSDGYTFLVGVWSKPAGERGKDWLAPRARVRSRIDEAFERFTVVGFWFDPSHAKDDEDEDGSFYWDAMLDAVMRDHGPKIPKAHWAVRGGTDPHAVMWDMTSPARSAAFVGGAERVVEDFERLNDVEEYDPAFRIDGHPILVQHLHNAIAYPTKWGDSLGKESRGSMRKIDAAVCLVGAHLLRRHVLNIEVDDKEERTGAVWAY